MPHFIVGLKCHLGDKNLNDHSFLRLHNFYAFLNSDIPDQLVHTRYADDIHGVFELLHVLVEQVILLLSFALLHEPRTGDIDGGPGFLILEKHLSGTFPQTFLAFLWVVVLCGELQVNLTFLL